MNLNDALVIVGGIAWFLIGIRYVWKYGRLLTRTAKALLLVVDVAAIVIALLWRYLSLEDWALIPAAIGYYLVGFNNRPLLQLAGVLDGSGNGRRA